MQHTTNYNLNQWEDSDRVTREDVNGAMSSIDSAIANASPWVKLLDVTVAESTAQIDLDVSGFDLTQYAFLLVYPRGSATSSLARVRYNNIATESYSVSGRTENYAASLSFGGVAGYLLVHLLEDRVCTEVRNFTSSNYGASGGNTTVVNASTLQTINITPQSGYIMEGSSFRVYGFKL